MNIFSGLRRTNKLYPNNNSFITDNANLVIPNTPSGFGNVFTNPNTINIGNNRHVPGYGSANNFLPSNAVNSAMRNNDVSSLRNIFNVNDTQISGLTQIRRSNNIPDAGLHANFLRRNAIKSNYPNLRTRTAQGVDNALVAQPRLSAYLKNIGIASLAGVGVVLVLKGVNLVQDIIDALNRTGGSFFHEGLNGGDEAIHCILRHRSCGINPNDIPSDMLCAFDPIFPNSEDLPELLSICQGFNYEREGSVCRASDPNADPDTYQYVDISSLTADRTLSCIEPYDLADLIGDLGLDWLLDDDGLINQSSNSSQSVSNSLLPLIIIVGVVLLLAIIGYVLFKRMASTPLPQQQSVRQ